MKLCLEIIRKYKVYFSEPTETLEISDFPQFFGNSSTSTGSKKFSMDDMIVSKV